MIIYDLMGQAFTLYLGRQGEKDARTLTFDLSCMRKKYGDGTLALAMKAPTGGNPYPVAVDVSGDVATWTVSNVETDVPGVGEAQFTYTVDGVIKKTVIYKTLVDPSLTPLSEKAPDAFDNWLDELTQIGGQIVADKGEALTAISESKTEAIGDVQTAGTNAVNAVSSARTSALEDLSTTKTETLTDVSEARTEAVNAIHAEAEAAGGYAKQAEQAASDAQSSEQAAGQYAEEARSYAENLHFNESSSGNIVISVGG